MTALLWFASAVMALTLTLLVVASPGFNATWQPSSFDSAVRVDFEGGHGSGVHIGNGLILTAAHVAEAGLAQAHDPEAFIVKTRQGKEFLAEVLWVGKSHDVALLKATPVNDIPAAPLQCEAAPLGTDINLVGNPGSLEHVSLRGHIADEETDVSPRWPVAQLLDISAAPGVSGGPVFSETGVVVGIVVGGYSVVPFMGSWGLIAVSLPGPVLCEMLALHS